VPLLWAQGALKGEGHYNKESQGRMRRMYSQFEFDLSRYANNVYCSLLPELKDVPSQRVEVKLELEGSILRLRVNADDIVSLRAALNTWLGLLKIGYDCCNSTSFSHNF
jgi:KEOPS complex subunit Pcc1